MHENTTVPLSAFLFEIKIFFMEYAQQESEQRTQEWKALTGFHFCLIFLRYGKGWITCLYRRL